MVGINPAPGFPKPEEPSEPSVTCFRADGRHLPFAHNSFDAVLSVATMEHVNGVDLFLSEVARVLRPGGLFLAEFSPIWSSALGHHVYAVAGEKEARFWKPGKNPIPDYAHLLWTPEEMRSHLESSPCSEELIAPIIDWIYHGDSLNRLYFEDYMAAFAKTSLVVQHLRLGYDPPGGEAVSQLAKKYGPGHNFRCSSISAVFRKAPDGFVRSRVSPAYWAAQRELVSLVSNLRPRFRSSVKKAISHMVPFIGS